MNLKEIYFTWLSQQYTWSDATRKSYQSSLSKLDLSSSSSLLQSLGTLRKSQRDKTYNLRIVALRSLVKCLQEQQIDHELIQTINSLKKIKNEHVESHPPYSDLEVQKILAKSSGWRNQAIWIALNTGLRKSEIQSLNVSDVDLDNGWIHVRQGKGNKSRSVAIMDASKLTRWKKFRDLANVSGQHWLFTNRGSRPSMYSGSIFKVLSKKLGFAVKLHRCRATYGTKLYLKSNDQKLVQLQLGHSKSSTTDIYIQMSKEEISKRMRSVGGLY